MDTLFKRRRLQIWIACFAILLNALAPSISHAISARHGQPPAWIEICTVDGTKRIAAALRDSAETAPADNPVDHQFKHCPFCLLHAATFALPPPVAMSFDVMAGHDLFPFLFYRSPQPLFSWVVAHPRAPPVAS